MFKTYSQNQMQLLPQDLTASIPQDHIARLRLSKNSIFEILQC